MARSAAALRSLARVEIREIRRHRGRSLLVMLLVAVPVAAVMGGAIVARITSPTEQERVAQAMGRAELRVEVRGGFEDRLRIREILPPNVPVETVFLGTEVAKVPGRRLRARLIACNPGALAPSGLGAGMLALTQGRLPENSGEAAFSSPLAADLGLSPGDSITLGYGTRRVLTGFVVNPEKLDEPIVLRTLAAVEGQGVHLVLAGVESAAADSLARLVRDEGYGAVARSEAARADDMVTGLLISLGAIGLLEAALVIAAAFAVGLRRRQREIGLLGSVGASPRMLQTAILASAVLLSLGGGLAGMAFGTMAAAVIHPFLDGWNGRLNGPFEWPAEFAFMAISMGVVSALAAAALPTRGAVRLPILVALRGLRPPGAPPRLWLAAGTGAVTLGLAMIVAGPRDPAMLAAASVVGGSILGVLGFGALSPWVLDRLAKPAGQLPLVWRLAVRDAGRFRSRNGPVVTAVLAGMSMSVTGAILLASVESALDAFPKPLRADQLLVQGAGAEEAAGRLLLELDGMAAAPLAAAYIHGQPLRARFAGLDSSEARRPEWVAMGGEDLLCALGAEPGLEAFREGHLLVLEPPVNGGPVTLTRWVGGESIPTPPVTRTRVEEQVREPAFLINQAAVASRGLETGPPLRSTLVPWVVRLRDPVTRDVLNEAQEIAAASLHASVDAAVAHQRPTRLFFGLALGICLLTGVIVLAAATSLSSSEAAGDAVLLHTVGASPGVLRGIAAARTGYLAAIGCALALPAGLIPAVALFRAANFPLPLVVPWGDMLLVLLGLPVLVMAGDWLRNTPAQAPMAAPRERP